MSQPTSSNKSLRSSRSVVSKPRSNSSSAALGSPSVSTVESTKSDHFPCGECKQKVNEGSNAVECEICVRWFHMDCAGLNSEAIRSLAKPGIHWFCKNCDEMQIKFGYQI